MHLNLADSLFTEWDLSNVLHVASRCDDSLKLATFSLCHLMHLIQSVLSFLHQILLSPIRRTLLNRVEVRFSRVPGPPSDIDTLLEPTLASLMELITSPHSHDILWRSHPVGHSLENASFLGSSDCAKRSTCCVGCAAKVEHRFHHAVSRVIEPLVRPHGIAILALIENMWLISGDLRAIV